MTRPTTVKEAMARPRTPGEARLMLLQERGTSLSKIARALGKDLSVVSRVVHGRRRSESVELEIARRLGLSQADAFPEWRRDR